MTRQPSSERFRQAVRRTYAWLGSLVWALGGGLTAGWLVDSDDTLVRAAAVAIGATSLWPYLWVVLWMVRSGDEFTRRIHLIAAAIAFGASLMILSLLAWLDDAHFIHRPPLQLLWLVFALLWAVAIVVVARYFKRPL